MGDKMNNSEQELEKQSDELGSQIDIDKTKRKFSKAGLAVPVLMTLANRPAWGNANTQCQVSGFNSLAVVGNKVSGVTYDPNESCGARFDWATNENRKNWPMPCIAVDKKNNKTTTNIVTYTVYSSGANVDYLSLAEVATANPGSIFKVSDIFSSFSGNKTIYDAIRRVSNSNATSEQIFLGNMLSLYMSSDKGGYSALSKAQIVDLYDVFKSSGGSYEITPGVTWTITEFDAYLAYLKLH
mgnify:CR=1 FL=1